MYPTSEYISTTTTTKQMGIGSYAPTVFISIIAQV